MNNEKKEDIFIRNPARQNQVAPQKYEPNYVRLGKDPIKTDAEMYTSVDNDVFDKDNKKSDVRGHIIDNNEFVNFDADPVPIKLIDKPENTAPMVGDYILMVDGKLILSGTLQRIESKVKAIIYGEDESFHDVGIEDIVVLKRIGIKVGVFIQE